MEIEIISREYIKPSSPTPHHLKIYKLSLLDQIIPNTCIPFVLYYPSTTHKGNIPTFNNAVETKQVLKQSLSVNLTQFYPLAGRIMKDGLSVDCNDEGIVFAVAYVKGKLSDVMDNPDTRASCARLHIPNENCADSDRTLATASKSNVVMMIQINYFDCGGMAIGLVFRHGVLDAVTLAAFLKSWAATAREGCEVQGQGVTIPDCKTAPSMFPQNETLTGPSESNLFFGMLQYFKKGKTIMRRYVFDASAISTLKARLIKEFEAEGSINDNRPLSRVETVSAFIWKCFMTASIANKKSMSTISHSMNLRRRVGAKSPNLETCFGNLMWSAPTRSPNQTDMGLSQLVQKIRDATGKFNHEFINTMAGDKGFLSCARNIQETWDSFPKESDFLSMASWCNFGLYTVDFGWGKPVWLNGCHAGSNDSEMPFLNFVWFMDTRDGAGIEAWVILEDKYMAAFDNIKDLRILASTDPNPLQIANTLL